MPSDGEVPTAIKLEGGGVKALMALPLKIEFFYGYTLRNIDISFR